MGVIYDRWTKLVAVGSSQLAPKLILVGKDEPQKVQKGTKGLEENNGFKAIEYLRNDPEMKLNATLIILDLEMPIMKGWDFLDGFGKLVGMKREDFKIVVSSSSKNPEDIHKALEYENVHEYIPKPMTIEIFRRLVERQ